jgi:hypothetical protein
MSETIPDVIQAVELDGVAVSAGERQSHAHDNTALPHSVGEQEPSIPDPGRLRLVPGSRVVVDDDG